MKLQYQKYRMSVMISEFKKKSLTPKWNVSGMKNHCNTSLS